MRSALRCSTIILGCCAEQDQDSVGPTAALRVLCTRSESIALVPVLAAAGRLWAREPTAAPCIRSPGFPLPVRETCVVSVGRGPSQCGHPAAPCASSVARLPSLSPAHVKFSPPESMPPELVTLSALSSPHSLSLDVTKL